MRALWCERTMHAMRLITEGTPLVDTELPLPEVGARSVLVRVSRAGVCHSDLHLIAGSYDLGEGRKLSATGGGNYLPLTPGHEIAGTVERLGEGLESVGIRPGDPVVVYPWIGCGQCRKCAVGQENLCEGTQRFLGYMRDGGFADYVLVPDARYLVRADGLDPAPAATLSCSGLTAFSSVRRCGLRSDDLLVILGAGGLGTAAIQIAKRTTGAQVAVADIEPDKLELATSLGADFVLNSAELDEKEIVRRVRALHSGRGADAVIDFVGMPKTSSLGLRLLGRSGRLVLVGLVGGGMLLSLPILPLLGSQVIGNFTGSRGELIELVELAKRGTVAPVISGEYPLREANEALHKLERGEVRGRVVLRP